jgi:hypothetical protein
MRGVESRAAAGWAALAVCLLAQVFLFTYRMDLLPMWDDELFTVRTAALPPAGILEEVRGDIHPPLYYLIAHYAAAGAGDPLGRLRLLSVMLTLASTLVFAGLLTARAPAPVRAWALALWAVSPCLLLYSRMARSYSLQLLLALLVCWSALRLRDKPEAWGRLAAWVACMAALLYTHYLPGVALLVGANVWLASGAGRLRRPRLAAANALVLAAYSPWLPALIEALADWEGKSPYRSAGTAAVDLAVKSGFWFVSFFFGESLTVWMLAAAAILAIPGLWLLWSGIREARRWRLPLLIVTAAALAGTAGWASYAFLPARLLFLLPAALLAVAAGAARLGRAGVVIAGALIALNVAGVWTYFQGRDLLNIGYLAPLPAMARAISAASSGVDTLVIADPVNLSVEVLAYHLKPGLSMRRIRSKGEAEKVWAELGHPAIGHVWLVRNLHDVTPGRGLEWIEEQLRGSWQARVHPYMRFSETHLVLMRIAAQINPEGGWEQPPEYMFAAWEFHRADDAARGKE